MEIEHQEGQEIEGLNEVERQISLTRNDSGISYVPSSQSSGDVVVYEDPKPRRKKKKIDLVDAEMVMTLDRTTTTSRNATYLLASTSKRLGVNFQDVILSHSTVHRRRNKHRKAIAEASNRNLDRENITTLHWDGKLLPDITGEDIVDRLPILVSGYNVEELLAVPKLTVATGKSQAEVILEAVQEYELKSSVKALSFDTTPVNTGKFLHVLLVTKLCAF